MPSCTHIVPSGQKWRCKQPLSTIVSQLFLQIVITLFKDTTVQIERKVNNKQTIITKTNEFSTPGIYKNACIVVQTLPIQP